MGYRTLDAFPLRDLWPTSWGSSGKLVIGLTHDLVDEDGREYPATANLGTGSLSSLGFHWESDITVTEGRAATGAIADLPTTDTALPPYISPYRVYVYDEKGVERLCLTTRSFHLRESLPDVFLWREWVTANQFRQRPRATSLTGDYDRIRAMIDEREPAPFASDLIAGIGFSDVPPSDPSHPEFVGSNSPLLLTDDQRAALVGTVGTPSDSNRFVTNDDTRANAFLNPKAYPYNAAGDGVADDTAELQDVIDDLDWSIGGLIIIPAGRYKTSANINLPREAQYETYSQVTILAYGVVIEPTTAVTAVFEYMPTSHSEAYNVIYNRISIFGLQVKAATRTSGQVAIRIGATEGLHLQDCDFVNIDGTDLVFAIRPVIDNCNTSRPTQYGFGIRSGKDAWAGETADGAPSNVPVLRSCRVWPGAGSIADFYIEGSDQWALYDCISDSFDAGVTGAGVPQYNLLVDETNYTLGQGGIVSGFYTEANNNPTTAVFGIKAKGKVILERVRRYDPGTVVWVDATGSTSAAEITLRDWSRSDAMPVARFRTASGVQWLFDHIGESSSQFYLNAAWWVGGTVGIVSQWGKYGIVVTSGSSDPVGLQAGRYDSADARLSVGLAASSGDWLSGTVANDVVIRQRDKTKGILIGVGNGANSDEKGCAKFDGNSTANETRFLVYDITAGTLRRVSIGADDSGGTGFRVLRIPN